MFYRLKHKHIAHYRELLSNTPKNYKNLCLYKFIKNLFKILQSQKTNSVKAPENHKKATKITITKTPQSADFRHFYNTPTNRVP